MTGLLVHAQSLAGRRCRTGSLPNHETLTFTSPGENNHCVVDSPHLLFGSFPFKVVVDRHLILPRPGLREVAAKFPIPGPEFLPPDGANVRELHTFVGLA